MATKQQYNKLVKKIEKRYPETKIKYKEDYLFWKSMPNTLRYSGLTLGKTIWMPKRNYNFDTLAHEYQHIVDFDRLGIGFFLMYCSPQIYCAFGIILGILALGFNLTSLGIAILLASLILLAPWPSKSRTRLEMNGYTMSMFVAALEGHNLFQYSKYVIDSLRSWLYYKMVWTDKETSNLILGAYDSINNKETIINKHIAFRDVYEILTE